MLGIRKSIWVVEDSELFVVEVFFAYRTVSPSCKLVYGGGPKLANEAVITNIVAIEYGIRDNIMRDL